MFTPLTPEEIAEKYNLIPVNMLDPETHEPVACIDWQTIYFLLNEIEAEVALMSPATNQFDFPTYNGGSNE